MKPHKTAYIALGSNKGNKFEYLQRAITYIFQRIGAIKRISKVYNSKALGFDGNDFYNACIAVNTTLQPEELLTQLQTIETKLGRDTKTTTAYQNRVIDLDIIFYDSKILITETLTIPHKQFYNRKFVLQPLADINKNFTDPASQKTVTQLLHDTKDTSTLEPLNIWLKHPKKTFNFSTFNFVAIEGNIGAGKTSLSTQIAAEFNAKLMLERFADNPFLPKFYKAPERYAFTLEMSFLADRYQQISDDLAQLNLFKDFVVSDYDVHKSLIFSKVTLPEDEFRLYRKLFNQVYKDIPKPNLYVYLHQNVERLKQNIKKRGRDYEAQIQPEYLEKINTGYLEFLKSQPDLNVKIIDVSHKDFVENRSDYVWILEQILS